MKIIILSLLCAVSALWLNAQYYSRPAGSVPGELSFNQGALRGTYGNVITKARGEYVFQGEQNEGFLKATGKTDPAGILGQTGVYISGFGLALNF